MFHYLERQSKSISHMRYNMDPQAVIIVFVYFLLYRVTQLLETYINDPDLLASFQPHVTTWDLKCSVFSTSSLMDWWLLPCKDERRAIFPAL